MYLFDILMSNIDPKYVLVILIPLLLVGGFLFLGSDDPEPTSPARNVDNTCAEGFREVDGRCFPSSPSEPEPVAEPVVEPEPVPDMLNPDPIQSSTIISISSLDIEGNSVTVSVNIDGDFDHWHINLDNQLSESGVAGGIMVNYQFSYIFTDVQPGEHTVYVGAVDSSHSLVGEQASQTFTVAELVVEEPELECEFGFAKVEIDMVESCEMIVIREDFMMELKGDFQFKELTIQKGVTVTWKTTEEILGAGGDVNYHQVFEINGLFDSGPLILNKKWSYTFNEVGVFEYVCPPHPWMVGKITVVEE